MKPELLLPVGNTESFYAAVEGGADAVYLGLRSFNARGRATNFFPNQLQSLLKEANQLNIKVYLTLNTLIKNNELLKLLDILYLLSQTKISSIIIQDWGVYYFLKKYFPNLPIYASTQIGIHNSVGVNFADSLGFERIILARELTLYELEKISRKTNIELEIFAHGALCYSFSGECLFSSFLGGMSANRGLCRQPCRRIYHMPEKSGYFFSLKDNQLIDFLPEILKLNISGLKIEGRMRSAEYVYQVARAYRMAIDDPQKIGTAKEILKYDFGREKTAYFLGRDIKNAITKNPYIGIFIGEIAQNTPDSFSFKTLHKLKIMDRLRILPETGSDAKAIKIKEMWKNEKRCSHIEIGEQVKIQTDKIKVEKGDKVFLIGLAEIKFKNKFVLQGKRLKLQLSSEKKKNILGKIGSRKILKREELFVRIDSLKWLGKIFFDKIDFLILNLSKSEWTELDFRKNFLRKNLHKIIIQLPKFIPEDDLIFFQQLVETCFREGITDFMLNHLYQKLLLPDSTRITLCTSENVYALNDVTIQFLKEEFIKFNIYAFENDHQNLIAGKDRKGIVPLFFVPELFYSRMPVFLNSEDTSLLQQLPDTPRQAKAHSFIDKSLKYKKVVKDGITIIVPEIPVSILQHKNKLFKEGFRRFLIDFSHQHPSQKTFNRILKKYQTSSSEYPSTIFNFKDGLR